MRSVCKLCIAVVIPLLLAGCKTVPIEQRAPIAVPKGLTANDVEVAVLYDLANQNIPADLTPGERIADSAMKALFLFRYQTVSDRKPGWYPESAEQGVIYAGFEKGPFYLRVAIEYTDSAIQTRLIESRNLSQTNTRIHKAAVLWIDQLEMRIRRSLGQLAAVRALEGREPE
ncbi:MAG: hypothetical protein WEF50_15705 [Myxococcota bacterium]